MIEDFLVPPKSAKDIEQTMLACATHSMFRMRGRQMLLIFWNESFQIFFDFYSDGFRPDDEMAAIGDAEAYTEFNPPLIAVRNSTYLLASHRNGRARMTFACSVIREKPRRP